MPIVTLKSGSLFDTGALVNPGTQAVVGGYRDRLSLIVYAGKFAASTGEVTVTNEDLKRLVDNHNQRVKTFGANILKCPPIQLDHSRSASATVGRLIGEVQLGEHTLADGTVVMAVLGVARFLGKENVEKADDGRYGCLSIGADFAAGYIDELTVTPFPAARDASLLTGTGETKKDALMWDDDKKAKLKKYLTGVKKMSESDADQYVAKCAADKDEGDKLSAESDEHDKKEEEARLTAEKDEKEKKDADLRASEAARVTKLTAANASISKLVAQFEASVKIARLAASKGSIISQLSRLRADAKVTPAEIKKMNIDELAAKTPAEIAATISSFENREPVIHVGQVGTIKAVTLASIGSKKARVAGEIEKEIQILSGMTTLGEDGKKRLAQLRKELETPLAQTVRIEESSTENVAYFTAEYDKLCALIDTDTAGAKKQLKAWLSKVSTLAGSDDHVDSGSSETVAQLTALAKTVEDLHNSFSELKNITTQLAAV